MEPENPDDRVLQSRESDPDPIDQLIDQLLPLLTYLKGPRELYLPRHHR